MDDDRYYEYVEEELKRIRRKYNESRRTIKRNQQE